MPRRNCFYSFHYQPDCTRAAQVRNIGVVEGNSPASDNDWETVKKGGERAIENWIARQMKGRSCTIVLVGTATANRKWINYEIIRSWNEGMGVVGIHIHGLRNIGGDLSIKGKNPFQVITHGKTGNKLSSIVNCYDPAGSSSQERYAWIAKHLSIVVEEALRIRRAN